VQACPEAGVLELVHGQAAVVNAALCVGHARCVAECPVGAVTLTQGDLDKRRDVPVLDDELQAVGNEGIYLVGEITAKSLIRTATVQGAQVARRIAARAPALARAGCGRDDGEPLDAVIVGAGPGGLACALGCREEGLEFVLIDQEAVIGGTVAKYPRRKLVLTEPIELPLHGRMPQREYSKEELIELWQGIADRHELPFQGGVTFEKIERRDDGTFDVLTSAGAWHARHVVLAVGRRGSPRRLGVPGEDLPHVAYSLIDAGAYDGCHAVIVGGGDSAVEAALGLAEHGDNTITIVYRQDEFFRIRTKNRERIASKIDADRVRVLFRSEVDAIHPDRVDVVTRAGDDGGQEQRVSLRADCVFVLAGGVAPFGLLEQSGVSFDPAMRPAAPPPPQEQGPGIVPALIGGLVLTAATFAFALWHLDYYGLRASERAADPKHALLRPDQNLGLTFGILAVVAILANLAYLLRRTQRWRVTFGSLTTWMTVHVATGVVAVLLAILHAAMSPRQTPGGNAFWALCALLVTGAIGRWFYAWLPRAANGRELELAAVRGELDRLAAAASTRGFAATARAEIKAMLDRRQWRSTFVGRVLAVLGLQWDLSRTLRRLRRTALTEGIPAAEVDGVLAQARAAHRATVAAAHLEDLRAMLGTWRWFHRWLALLMVLLVVVHVVLAALHGAFSFGGGS
jgi:thioredoxin reductase